MKKVIFSLALISFSALASFAQAKQECPLNVQQCANRTECVNADRMDKAFEGINLTADQKTKLEALCKSQCEAVSGKCNKIEGRNEEKKKAERISREQVMQKHKERRMQKEANRRQYIAKVKEILTPEQYVVFLENSYVVRDDMPKGVRKFDKKGKPGKIAKEGKGLHKMKPNRQKEDKKD